jgi:hypothetical protein
MSGWTYPYASGVEVTRGAILAALGQVPQNLKPARSWTSAERAFISIPGRVRSLHGLEKAGALPHVKDVFLRVQPGGTVTFPENNVTKCGNVIAAAAVREAAVNAADSAVRTIRIRLEAPNAETDAFLGLDPRSLWGFAPKYELHKVPLAPEACPGESGFPPDAFSLTPDLAALVAALPESILLAASSAPSGPSLFPFPAFVESGLRDYQGRTVEESLMAVRELTGFPLAFDTNPMSLGRGFWAALIRGGYQGALYYVDRYFPAELQ